MGARASRHAGDAPTTRPNKSDVRAMKARGRSENDLHAEIYEQGRQDARAETPAPTSSGGGGGGGGSSSPGVVDDGAGFVLGLLSYALVLAYLRGGTEGVRAWLRAKFLNEASADLAKMPTPAPPSAPDLGGPRAALRASR